MKRGGYKRNTNQVVNYDLATCEAHEAILEIRALETWNPKNSTPMSDL